MQDPNSPPWGAIDRFQARFVVRRDTGHGEDFVTRTVLKATGHFAAKKIASVSWNGGRIAEVLNADTALSDMISGESTKDADIHIEPTSTGVRIRSKWKNHLELKIAKEMFQIYDKIAGHAKSP